MPIGTGYGTDRLPYHLRAAKFKADKQVFLGWKPIGCINYNNHCARLTRAILYWLPKVLGLTSTILGTLASIKSAKGDQSFQNGERVAQGVLLILTWVFELLVISLAKSIELNHQRRNYCNNSAAGNEPTDPNRGNRDNCCACDTLWPLVFFHSVCAIMGFIGYFDSNLNDETRSVLTIVAPFLLFTAVGITHEKVDEEVSLIQGPLIRKVDRNNSTTLVPYSSANAEDPADASPACCWVCC